MSVFHRKANRFTQTTKTAVAQHRTRELRGKGAFGGLPAALAYIGPLGSDEQGTQFTSTVPFARNGHPEWAYWYLPEHGGDDRVIERGLGSQTFACVPIDPVLHRYGCR